jgi:TonB family protein
MNREPNQTIIFGSEINPPVPWRTYATSVAVHTAAVVVLLLIPIAVTQEAREHLQSVTTLIAPQLKPYKPEPPKIRTPKLLAKSVVVPKPVPEVKRPEIKPVVPPPPVIKETPKPIPQPEVAAPAPKPIPRIQAPEVAPAPAIRPQVHTGVFGSEEAAKKVDSQKELKVGGFGDPNGVKASPDSQKTFMAKVGAFEMPQGDGDAGGRGGQGRGTVRQTSFGSAEGAGSGPGGNGKGIGQGTVRQSGFGSADGGGGNGTGGNGRGGAVKTGGFGETGSAGPVQTARPKATVPATTPVEILSKPKPVYTQEARQLHLEGEVSLEVIFSASGSVQVVRVVQGLGHGLDEAAEQAASRIRFRPGTRDGAPVDTRATIHITFELT